MKKKINTLNPKLHESGLTSFRISKSGQSSQQSCNCRPAHDIPNREEWVETNCSLAHVPDLVRCGGTSSIAFGAFMQASLLKCGVMGEPPGPLSFLSHSEPHPPSSASPYFGAAPTLGVRRPPPAYRALASWHCVPFVPVRVSKRLSLLSL